MNHGRVLIADEMGVGKTLQALCVAWLFKEDWPLCIICPATLKLNWKDEILKFFQNNIDPEGIHVVKEGKKKLPKDCKIIIASYEIAKKKADELQMIGINSVIADEAHYMKNEWTARSKALVPLMQACKRVILLTGTPAFARPQELYNLCHIVRPDIFDNFKVFGERYCDPRINPFSRKLEYSGSNNLKELNYVLKSSFMIRRLKKDVLSELPSKVRQKIPIECDSGIISEINQVKEQLRRKKADVGDYFEKMGTSSSFLQNSEGENDSQDPRSEVGALLQKLYMLTGQAKVNSTCKFIEDLLDNDIKFLVFGHHLEILTQIEETIKKKMKNGTSYIRIDGSTNLTTRHEFVKKFNNEDSCKVALLSLTAASQGITMTSAFTVVFAEIHWTPAIMVQAEDRCHRITQVNNVTCFYLYGDQTLDEELYDKVIKKFTTVSKFLDSKQQSYDFQNSNSNSLANSLSVAHEISTKPQKLTKISESEEEAIEEVNELEEEQKEQREASFSFPKFDYVKSKPGKWNKQSRKPKETKEDKNIMGIVENWAKNTKENQETMGGDKKEEEDGGLPFDDQNSKGEFGDFDLEEIEKIDWDEVRREFEEKKENWPELNSHQKGPSNIPQPQEPISIENGIVYHQPLPQHSAQNPSTIQPLGMLNEKHKAAVIAFEDPYQPGSITTAESSYPKPSQQIPPAKPKGRNSSGYVGKKNQMSIDQFCLKRRKPEDEEDEENKSSLNITRPIVTRVRGALEIERPVESKGEPVEEKAGLDLGNRQRAPLNLRLPGTLERRIRETKQKEENSATSSEKKENLFRLENDKDKHQSSKKPNGESTKQNETGNNVEMEWAPTWNRRVKKNEFF